MAATQATRQNGTPVSVASSAPIPRGVYLSAEKAAKIDEELMGDVYGYTLNQLMELAGLAVAHAVADFAPLRETACICVVCGPGNNGGDGLVAARHLHLFGYEVYVQYPKRVQRAPFIGLVKQLEVMEVPFVDCLPTGVSVIVDAVFGFSFRGTGGVREPFGSAIAKINESEASIICVDVPSGWDVDHGDVGHWERIRKPAMVVSLTGPKLCMRALDNTRAVPHYVGGRFVPKRMERELEFVVPSYPGTADIMRIS